MLKVNRFIYFVGFMWRFGILLGTTMSALERDVGSQSLRIAISLLPIIPFGFALFSLLKHIKSLDELKVKIALDACFISVIMVSMIAVLLGLLELSGVLENIPTLSFPILLITVWGLVQFAVAKRFS